MNTEPLAAARDFSRLESEAGFTRWVHEVVNNAAELQAFETGQVDAIMDAASGVAVLAPAARAALVRSSQLARGAFDALSGEVCVLDLAGTVVMTSGPWRAFAAACGGAGLGVREGGNFFAACRNAAANERVNAAAVAAGLRRVLAGARPSFRREYVCGPPGSHCAFTLVIARMDAEGAVHAVVTRENVRKIRAARRIAAMARAGTPNRLLATLSDGEYERLLTKLELVNVTCGQVLQEPDDQIQYVYFPGDSLVSLLIIIEGRKSLEVGLVGREGVVGYRLALGSAISAVRAVVQGTGTAARMKSTHFLQELQRSPALQSAMLCFIDTLMVQITQTAVCNRYHVVKQRLARLLLMTRERASSDHFYLTHTFLAGMLGTRREGVTDAAIALKDGRLIDYQRGNITILDQRGLEAASCSCYQRVRIPRA